MEKYKAFKDPIHVVRPILPDVDAICDKIKTICKSQILTNGGAQHQELEKKVKAYLAVDNCSLFCNGTLALDIAIKALDLKGEVITTPFTFPATTHVLYNNNIQPVFCDIENSTYNIDPEKIESLITDQTTAILPVHVFGNPCDVEKIQQIADKHKLKVIYDAAHAFGVKVNGKSIARFGDISMFSFHATKIFHTIEGGALTYRDDLLRDKIEQLKNFGLKDEIHVDFPGTNAKMNEVQAAIGLLIFDYLNEAKAKRKEITEIYQENLKSLKGIEFIKHKENVDYNYYSMPVTIVEQDFGISRDELHDKLNVTSIVVTHDMKSAYKVADKIAMLYEGKIIAEGTPDEIRYTHDPVVHQFITGAAKGPITGPARE